MKNSDERPPSKSPSESGVMDGLDRLILQTLQEDGRAPFTQIARQAGVSEATIRARYRDLAEKGVVRTVGIVDPYALGFQAPAIIGVSVEPGTVEQVARKIGALSEVSYLVMTLGRFDLIVEVFCRDLPQLTNLLVQAIQTIPGVRATEMLMIARSYKLTYRWAPALETAYSPHPTPVPPPLSQFWERGGGRGRGEGRIHGRCHNVRLER
jgi:Lrp/AsnC family transcriptional regulator for asnA, asnC and gidA